MTALVVLLAVILDKLLGEPNRWHPLVGFGHVVKKVEGFLWRNNMSAFHGRLKGIVACLLLLLPLWWLGCWLEEGLTMSVTLALLVEASVVSVCIGLRSLKEHVRAISQPLLQGDLKQAGKRLGYIVSRDTTGLTEQEVVAASCESILENGSDSVFAALFWFCVGGLPAILLYRAVNTLDAMWGYRNDRFLYFGWAAARLDDVMNWIPARLVAFSYGLVSNFMAAIQCWREQGSRWKSPNAGPVMAAGAGGLNIRLGGAAQYQGESQERPVLGCGELPVAADIERALALLDRTVMLWLLAVFGMAFMSGVYNV